MVAKKTGKEIQKGKKLKAGTLAHSPKMLRAAALKRAPGTVLRAPGTVLRAPGTVLRSPGTVLRSPGGPVSS
jgi:hypothetical protein